jgi:hypothetical protein
VAFGDFAALLDNFNRANETPLSGGGNWPGKINSGHQAVNLASNSAAPSSTGNSSAYWVTNMGPNVEASVLVTAKPANTQNCQVWVRITG